MKKNSVPDKKTAKPKKIKNSQLEEFLKLHKKIEIVDQYEKNLEDLFLLRNPQFKFNKEYKKEFSIFKKKHYGDKPKNLAGSWFYYPWINTLIHFFSDKMHQELRTGRNKYLITKEEQDKFYGACVGVLGMSVGSHVAVVIAMTGGAKHIKIGDPDTLSGDNLNRIRSGYQNVGLPKVVAVARQIYEFNPYAKVEIFKEGLTKSNINKFMKGSRKLDILVEEMDNPYMKIAVRLEARRLGIPVIMAADNGDGAIVDIERYDLNKKSRILHGILGDIDSKYFARLSPQELPQAIVEIVGTDLAVNRMLYSVTEVGRSIYSWPQLGTAANLCGTVLGYLARRIVLKDSKIHSGRYALNLDSIFEKDYHHPRTKAAREKERLEILKDLGL